MHTPPPKKKKTFYNHFSHCGSFAQQDILNRSLYFPLAKLALALVGKEIQDKGSPSTRVLTGDTIIPAPKKLTAGWGRLGNEQRVVMQLERCSTYGLQCALFQVGSLLGEVAVLPVCISLFRSSKTQVWPFPIPEFMI